MGLKPLENGNQKKIALLLVAAMLALQINADKGYYNVQSYCDPSICPSSTFDQQTQMTCPEPGKNMASYKLDDNTGEIQVKITTDVETSINVGFNINSKEAIGFPTDLDQGFYMMPCSIDMNSEQKTFQSKYCYDDDNVFQPDRIFMTKTRMDDNIGRLFYLDACNFVLYK